MAGFRPYSEIIGNGRILKFLAKFLANLFSIKKKAYTKILRLVGVCVGEFFTKNTLKNIGQSFLKTDFLAKFFFIVKNVQSSIALREIDLISPRGGARERVENFSKIFLERHQVYKISTYAYISK